MALDLCAAEGAGIVVRLRGHLGPAHKMQADALQDRGYDTVDANTAPGLSADSREYGIGAVIPYRLRCAPAAARHRQPAPSTADCPASICSSSVASPSASR